MQWKNISTETNLQIEKLSVLIKNCAYVYPQIHFSCLSYNLMPKKAAAKLITIIYRVLPLWVDIFHTMIFN